MCRGLRPTPSSRRRSGTRRGSVAPVVASGDRVDRAVTQQLGLVAAQPLVPGPPLGKRLLKGVPKSARVVGNTQVTELVDDHVTGNGNRRQEQSPVEGDGAGGRARAPACALSTDREPRRTNPEPLGLGCQQGAQASSGGPPIPALQSRGATQPRWAANDDRRAAVACHSRAARPRLDRTGDASDIRPSEHAKRRRTRSVGIRGERWRRMRRRRVHCRYLRERRVSGKTRGGCGSIRRRRHGELGSPDSNRDLRAPKARVLPLDHSPSAAAAV